VPVLFLLLRPDGGGRGCHVTTEQDQVLLDQFVPAVLYQYHLASGDSYRNVEFIAVRDGQLVATQVFFGRKVLSA
jgi:hypothetical protein